MQRVVITGLGCLTPIGNTPEAAWESLEAGRSGIGPYVPEDGIPDPTLKFGNAAQIHGFQPSALSLVQVATTERCSQFAILAARQAAMQAQLVEHHRPENTAVILGCSTGGRHAEEPETMPERTMWKASPMAWAPEEQAVERVNAGPVIPRSIATCETPFEPMERATVSGGTRALSR
jgi:3-oxoacyl-(acyl-carrier-protein) synthase